MRNGGRLTFSLFCILILFFYLSGSVTADEDENTDETLQMQDELNEKKQVISDLNEQIETYQKKITQTQREKITLLNQLDLLQNRIAKTQLEMDATNAQMDLTQIEIRELEYRLMLIRDDLDQKREVIARVLQKIQSEDEQFPLAVFYSSENFSEFFQRLEQLQEINADLRETVDDVKESKQSLQEKRTQEENKQDQLEELENKLKEQNQRFQEEVDSKGLLVNETKESEQRFQRLLSDLKAEQSFVENQIQELQLSLEQKLKPEDALNGGQLSWPLNPSSRGISAFYHDPEYPFRYLFEHAGIDLPAPTGTTVRSAAPGYVAWTRRGPQYGNYVMVIHSDGIATLYAHLSRISVITDQYVARGDEIGLVGMTGLTTGPHLHFEVRKQGIPTNPLTYLPNYD